MKASNPPLWLRLLVYALLIGAGTFAAVEGMLTIQDWMNWRYTMQVRQEVHCCDEGQGGQGQALKNR